MIYKRLFSEELSREYIKRLSIDEVKLIEDFCISNSKFIFPLLKKLERYTSLDIERGVFTSKEIEQFNSIPVPENYNLRKELPVTIYRGLTISKELAKQIIPKIKAKKGKITYTPQESNYSSWTTDKETAESFSHGSYSSDLEVVFRANLTPKNKAIDIVTFQMITFNLQKYLEQKDSLNDKQKELLNIIKNVDRIDEKEILVFGKIKVDGIEE